MLCYSDSMPRGIVGSIYNAELGLGLGWGCLVLSVRLAHSNISVRLTYSCAMEK